MGVRISSGPSCAQGVMGAHFPEAEEEQVRFLLSTYALVVQWIEHKVSTLEMRVQFLPSVLVIVYNDFQSPLVQQTKMAGFEPADIGANPVGAIQICIVQWQNTSFVNLRWGSDSLCICKGCWYNLLLLHVWNVAISVEIRGVPLEYYCVMHYIHFRLLVMHYIVLPFFSGEILLWRICYYYIVVGKIYKP